MIRCHARQLAAGRSVVTFIKALHRQLVDGTVVSLNRQQAVRIYTPCNTEASPFQTLMLFNAPANSISMVATCSVVCADVVADSM